MILLMDILIHFCALETLMNSNVSSANSLTTQLRSNNAQECFIFSSIKELNGARQCSKRLRGIGSEVIWHQYYHSLKFRGVG